MTDIWDKKPVRPSLETTLMFERRRYSWEYQLKIEYDKLKEKAEKWDDLKNIVPKLEERLRLLEKLEAIKDYILKLRGVEEKIKMTGSLVIADALEKILEVEK